MNDTTCYFFVNVGGNIVLEKAINAHQAMQQAEKRHQLPATEAQQCPIDFEPCGECDFDHTYEYEAAYAYHTSELERQ